MPKSFSYYLTILVIRLKGIKKAFSQSPINYLAIRKDDVKMPKSKFFKSLKSNTFTINETSITEIKKDEKSNKLLIFFHGGAFISGPTQLHWDAIERIVKETNHTVWMCDYPKAPEHKIHQISSNIDAVYSFATQKFDTENIILLGDSAGGTLVIALTQRLIQKTHKLPSKLIIISPVLDSSFENIKIEAIDQKDPMLSKVGVLSAKTMCAEDGNLKNISLSPIYGSFNKFPKTHLFLAENDITYPDQVLLCEILKQTDVEYSVIEGKGMPHIWPLLPVMKEAKIALTKIIKLINEQ